MTKMTKAQTAKRESLKRDLFAAVDRVFDAGAPRNDLPFLSCLALASSEAREAYENARAMCHAFELDMVAQGRGYFDSYGHFKGHDK